MQQSHPSVTHWDDKKGHWDDKRGRWDDKRGYWDDKRGRWDDKRGYWDDKKRATWMTREGIGMTEDNVKTLIVNLSRL